MFDLGIKYLFESSTFVTILDVFSQIILLSTTFCLFMIPMLISPHTSTRSLVKRPSVGTMLSRFCSILVISQCLRIIMFLSTTLPGPHPRCRPDSPFYDLPSTLSDVFNPGYFFGSHNCGDGVFSMKVLFYTICTLMVYKYYRFSAVAAVTENCLMQSGGYGHFEQDSEFSSQHRPISNKTNHAETEDENQAEDSVVSNSDNSNASSTTSPVATTRARISRSGSLAEYDQESNETDEYGVMAGQALGEMLPFGEEDLLDEDTTDKTILGYVKKYLPIVLMIASLIFTSLTTIAERYHFSLNVFAAWFTVLLIYICLEEHYPDFPEDDSEEYADEKD